MEVRVFATIAAMWTGGSECIFSSPVLSINGTASISEYQKVGDLVVGSSKPPISALTLTVYHFNSQTLMNLTFNISTDEPDLTPRE